MPKGLCTIICGYGIPVVAEAANDLKARAKDQEVVHKLRAEFDTLTRLCLLALARANTGYLAANSHKNGPGFERFPPTAC